MLQKKQYRNWPTFALMLMLLAAVGYQSFGNRAAAPAPARPIATFDLERAFNDSAEKKARFADLVKLAENYQAENKKTEQDLKDLELELNDHQVGSAKYRELLDKWSYQSHDFTAQVNFQNTRLEIEKSRVIKELYLKIRQMAGELAKEQGYAVVLVDDSIQPFDDRRDMTAQISGRRIVYSDVDITDELIARMDKTFEAGGSTAAKPGS